MLTDLTLLRRIVALVVGALVVSGILIARVAWLDIHHGEVLHRISLEQRMHRVPVVAARGEILDRTGRALAISITADSVYAVPAQVSRPKREAAALAPIVDRPPAFLERRLKQRSGMVWLVRRLSAKAAGEVRALRLPGIVLAAESRRVYPYGPLAAEMIGFSGVDNRGLAGAELSLNRLLEGKNGYVASEFDAIGRHIPRGRSQYTPPVPGNTVVLTIDVGVQRMAESEAAYVASETGAERVLIALMQVQSGALLALAVRPTFDPSRYAEFEPSLWRNPGVSDTYPPGSTFKPITAAAGLAAGVIQPETGFFDPGFIVVNGRRIRCWKAGGHGSLDFAHVVAHSCNVGFVETGLRLGTNRFYHYLAEFGLTHKTGIDLPGEARPLLPKEADVKPVDLAVMAFGQTLTVTPLGLLDALNTIADGGTLLKPQIVDEVISSQGRVMHRLRPDVVRRVLTPRVASDVAHMMTLVVSSGSGKKAAVRGYTVAGKTGTSQMVVNGQYAPGAYIASFVGFGPMPKPKVIGLVVIWRPQGEYYGGQTAAPAWGRLMSRVFPYLGVAQGSDRQWKMTRPVDEVPDVEGDSVPAAAAAVRRAGFSVRVIGHGRVAGTLPAAGQDGAQGSLVTVFAKAS